MRSDRERLLDIRAALSELQSYSGYPVSELEADAKLQVWVAWHIQIIGEAVSRLSPAMKEGYPEVRWRELAVVRNEIVHEYFQLDAQELLGVINQHLPALHAVVQQLLEQPELL